MKIKNIRKALLGVLLGANVASIVLMLVVGYAGRVSPVSYPMLSNLSMLFPFVMAVNFAFIIFWVVVKLRYVVVPLIGFAICYGPVRTYMPINLHGDIPDGALKVLSYNVWCYALESDFETSMKIPEYVAAENADIV